MRDDLVEFDVALPALAHALLLRLADLVSARGQLDPVTAHHAAVHHESQGVQHVRLERLERERGVVQTGHGHSLLLDDPSRRGHHVGQGRGHLDEGARLSLLEIHQRLLIADDLDGADERPVAPLVPAALVSRHGAVQGDAKGLAHLVFERVRNLSVKVRLEAVHVDAHAVAPRGHAEDSEPRAVALRLAVGAQHGVRLADDVVDVKLLEAEVVLGGVEGRRGLALPVLPLRVVRDVDL